MFKIVHNYGSCFVLFLLSVQCVFFIRNLVPVNECLKNMIKYV